MGSDQRNTGFRLRGNKNSFPSWEAFFLLNRAEEKVFLVGYPILYLFIESELRITLTEDKDIAAAAHIGFKSQPVNG